MASPFDILRIDPDADEAEIVRAYRRRVKETHPDQGGSRREFQQVRAAYERLTSEERRRRYETGRETVEDGTERKQSQRNQPQHNRSQRDQSHREPPRQERSRVEYLNYEVLDDHGWSLEDEDLFEKAAAEDLDHSDYGRFLVRPDESLLQAAENRGFTWPYSCRGGACANCAVAVADGEMSMPVNHVLPSEMVEHGIRLSCVGAPTTDELSVVYNVKHLPDLDELRLPPGPFEDALLDD